MEVSFRFIVLLSRFPELAGSQFSFAWTLPEPGHAFYSSRLTVFAGRHAARFGTGKNGGMSEKSQSVERFHESPCNFVKRQSRRACNQESGSQTLREILFQFCPAICFNVIESLCGKYQNFCDTYILKLLCLYCLLYLTQNCISLAILYR